MSPDTTPAQLAAELVASGQIMLVVDFDGTLANIVDEPDDAQLISGAANVLSRVASHMPVLILSGRDLDDLAPRLTGITCHVAGNHGARLATADGKRIDLVDRQSVARVLHSVSRKVSRIVGGDERWWIEDKYASIAIHYRQVPDADVRKILPTVSALLHEHASAPPGFEVLDGKAVLEFRVASVNKGTAVDWLITHNPGYLPVAIGDDVTDEDAFDVARRHGGRAIIVGTSSHQTSASAQLAGPKAVVALLDALAALTTKV